MFIITIFLSITLMMVLGIGQYRNNGKRAYNDRLFVIAASTLSVASSLVFINVHGNSCFRFVEKVAADAVTVSANAVWAELFFLMGGFFLLIGATFAFFMLTAKLVSRLCRG